MFWSVDSSNREFQTKMMYNVRPIRTISEILLRIHKNTFSFFKKRYFYEFSRMRKNRLLIAMFFKCGDQVISDYLRGSSFYLVPFYKMHQLAIFK
jgi:hypothetical protein